MSKDPIELRRVPVNYLCGRSVVLFRSMKKYAIQQEIQHGTFYQ